MGMTIEYSPLHCGMCSTQLQILHNHRMDEKLEKIPFCPTCKEAFRVAALGWEVLED